MGKQKNGKHKVTHCAYCGAEFTRVLPATTEHIWPKSKGGTGHAFNTCFVCQPCNQAKGDNVPPLTQTFDVMSTAIVYMVGNRNVREVEAVAIMVAAIAYYLRTKKMPRKNAGQINTKTL